jgi:tetratricopeptide (TPR) repeat protein
MNFIIITVAILFILFFGSLYIIRILNKAKLQASLDKIIKSGAKQDAITTLLTILQKNPLDTQNRMALVKIYMEEKKFPEAISHLNIMLTRGQRHQDFTTLEANKLLGECYFEVKNLDEAFKVFNLLRKNNPNDPYPYIQLGKIEKERDSIEKAAQYYNKALTLDPDNIDILKNLGVLLFVSNKYPEALNTLQNTLDKNPDDPEIHFYLGQINLIYKQQKEAFNHYIKAKNDQRFTAVSLLNIGKILRSYNKLEDARKVLVSFLKLTGLKTDDLLEGIYELAEVYLSMKDIQRTIALWEKILSITPEYRDVKSKLDRYEQTRKNTLLKAYMMSSRGEFLELCKKIALNYARNVVIIRTDLGQDASIEILVQAVYKDVGTTIFFKFFRGTSNVGQLVVREFYEKMKEVKAKHGVCITTSEYSSDALAFSEGRVLELLGRKELVRLLSRVNL